jgi:hypothetical protein
MNIKIFKIFNLKNFRIFKIYYIVFNNYYNHRLNNYFILNINFTLGISVFELCDFMKFFKFTPFSY